MAAPKLASIRLLKNHGALVVYRSTRGVRRRFVRPNGWLSVPEAAAVLSTYRNMIYRMDRAGILRLSAGQPHKVRLASVRRILRGGRRLVTANREAHK